MRLAVSAVAAALAAALTAMPARAQPAAPLRVYAAGSLTGAVSALLDAFGSKPGEGSIPTFGPSGVLRERIEAGEAVDLFASADMGQPRKLAAAGRGMPVVMFARNRMCAMARAGLGLSQANLLDRMLDPAVKVGTSTPGADPGGDYTWAAFSRAEAVHAGAEAALKAKALQLVGGPASKPLVPGQGFVEGVFLSGSADMMLGYCSGAAGLRKTIPDLVSVPFPESIDVSPEYGMTLISQNPAAARFGLFMMSEPGQTILAQFGLVPVAKP